MNNAPIVGFYFKKHRYDSTSRIGWVGGGGRREFV